MVPSPSQTLFRRKTFHNPVSAIRDLLEALQVGLKEKAKEFAKTGGEVYAKT